MARWAAAAGSRGTSPPPRGLNVAGPSPGSQRNRSHPGRQWAVSGKHSAEMALTIGLLRIKIVPLQHRETLRNANGWATELLNMGETYAEKGG